MKRTLSLKSERLVELSTDELTNVVGAQQKLPTTPVPDCVGITYTPNTCNCCTASASC